MSEIILKYFPKATLVLVAINVIVFVIVAVGNISKEDYQVKLCIKNAEENCIYQEPFGKQDHYDFYLCAKDISDEKLEYLCLQKIKDECYLKNELIKKCFSSKDKAFFLFGFVPKKAFVEPYRFITSIFLHANIEHLFANMFLLFIVGAYLEARLGAKKFILLFLLSGIFANFAYYIVHSNSVFPAIGASGAVFGLIGANMIINFGGRKNSSVYKMASIGKINTVGLSVGYILLAVWYQLIVAHFGPISNIGYSAHIGGFFGGLILAIFLNNSFKEYE